ncbi:MAG: hypothetical protein WDM89_07540 [Rhizomicrobium sp.]
MSLRLRKIENLDAICIDDVIRRADRLDAIVLLAFVPPNHPPTAGFPFAIADVKSVID